MADRAVAHVRAAGAHRTIIDDLAERIATIESGGNGCRSASISSGWRLPSGEELPLARGVLHEWVGLCDPREAASGARHWSPPLLLMIHLARCAASERSHVLWIGRRVWPHHHHLATGRPANHRRDAEDTEKWRNEKNHSLRSRRLCGEHAAPPSLLHRSLFIDPPSDSLRWWAIDQALRCGAISAVVADGSGMDMACSRRLQMAAESGSALALLARPPWEVKELSAAMTRWRVSPVLRRNGDVGRRVLAAGAHESSSYPPATRTSRLASSITPNPAWQIECLRCKGVQRRIGTDAVTQTSPLLLEWNRVTGCVGAPAELVDRSPAPQAATQRIA